MGLNTIQVNAEGKLYLRKSMIEAYHFCPMQFRKNWVEETPVIESYKMAVGTRFHEFAYWFFDVCGGVKPENWGELVPSRFTDFEQDMAAWWVEQEYKRFCAVHPDEFTPIEREVKLEDSVLCLTGTCDRMDWINKDEGVIAVTEYKTGASFDEKSIVGQLGFYKIMWENNIGLGSIRYLRYINPRRKEYRLIDIPPNINDIVYMNISQLRKAIREDAFPYRCSEVKHIICGLCSAEECGAYGV